MNRLRNHALPVARFHDALNSSLDALPDGELLDRFAQYADHPAFETLLRRHGAMVYGVCRRILAIADADDAFQATFLILIRKARSIRGGPLGPWLYGVACRVAMKARSRAARFAEFRAEAAEMIPDPTAPAEIPDWLPILDSELAALPAKYRDALVLCELQGASRAEAAKALGVREGTLSSRLARGRELLRKRLLRHGTLLPAGGLVALLSENGGRAAVPAALLSKISELAKVATGESAGVVPVGAARLTDEVLKSMFLTKLRVAGSAGLAALLLAVGATTAAWPGDSGGALPEEKGVTKRMATPNAPEGLPVPAAEQDERGAIGGLRDLHFVGGRDKGAAIPDRDAVQGLWVAEKADVFGKGVRDSSLKEIKEVVEKMQVLVVGDVWWCLFVGSNGDLFPRHATLDPKKNPKWLDWRELPAAGSRHPWLCIYELDGDVLRICMSESDPAIRPAEFATDPDVPLLAITFRRGKLPPAVGEKALVGSWVGETLVTKNGEKKREEVFTPRVEILDSYLFLLQDGKNGPEWMGGKYTVDTTKNPKWIDVELTAPRDDGKLTKVYGSYEVENGRLKLVLGSKRATRPLEFKDGGDAMFFDLGPAKPEAPMPKAKRTDDRRGEFDRLLEAGNFATAEKHIREASGWSDAKKVEARTQLGHALLLRAGDSTPRTAAGLYADAEKAFAAAVADFAKLPANEKAAPRLQWEAELGRLVALQNARRPDDLMTAAVGLLDRYSGKAEGLVILLFVREAYTQKGEVEKAGEIRERVKALYAKFPDSAFPDQAGHFSRNFWQTQGYAGK